MAQRALTVIRTLKNSSFSSSNRRNFLSDQVNPKCFNLQKLYSSSAPVSSNDEKKEETTAVEKPEEKQLTKAQDWIEHPPEQLSPETLAQQQYFAQKKSFRKPIYTIEESEYEDTMVCKKGRRPPWVKILDGTANYKPVAEPEVKSSGKGLWIFESQVHDWMSSKSKRQLLEWHQQDINWSMDGWKLRKERKKVEREIDNQRYDPERNTVLGNELAAAHFFLFRKCPVKFLGGHEWVKEYRADAEEGKEEEDLPAMQFDFCSLPTKYDANYILEGLDCSNFGSELRYEGLENLVGLRHIKYLKLKDCIHLDSFCIDRLISAFGESLKYLDISGCHSLTEGAVCAIARFKNLTTLVMYDLPQVRNKEIIAAILEERNPNLTVIGVDYDSKLEDLKRTNEELERIAAQEEAETVTVEPKHGPGPDPASEHKGLSIEPPRHSHTASV